MALAKVFGFSFIGLSYVFTGWANYIAGNGLNEAILWLLGLTLWWLMILFYVYIVRDAFGSFSDYDETR